MKKPTKPISSPGRSDKYPTPTPTPTPMMMSFMRTNVGNKSRSNRLCSTSPMFTRKKNTTPETQEPSSPKVTCMGQVRGSTGAAAHSFPRPGKVKRTGTPARKKNKNSCVELWRKWVPSFGAVFCYNARNIEEDKERREMRIGEEEEALGLGFDDEGEGFGRKAMSFCYGKDDDDVTSSPPKNALLLTRCRSAPYRSTSLAYRFWGSPNRAQEEEESKTEEEEEDMVENGGPTLESEKGNEEKIEDLKGLEDSMREGMGKSDEAEGIEDLREVEESSSSSSSSVQPLILRRCNSEPARTTAAEKLDVDCLIRSHQVFVIN